jgi:hypothetical protein
MGDYFKDVILVGLIVIAAVAWIIVRRKEIIASKPPKNLPPRQ